MALATIITNTKTTLDGVTNISSKTYTRLRLTTHWKDFLALFKDSNNKIHGWMITRISTAQSCLAQGSQLTKTHHIRIIGVYGLKDADDTETTFQTIVENVVTKFSTDDTLGGACWTCTPLQNAPSVSGIQVDVFEPRLFDDVLCHYCELSLYPQEIL